MSNSVWPHRQQSTRLPRPWDSPGKNTGVGCQFLLQCMKVKSESEVAQSCPTPRDPMDCSAPGSSVHGIFQARVWKDAQHGSLLEKVSKVKSFSHVRLFATPWIVTRLLCPWDFPGKNIGVGCHFLLQGIFPSQGSNPGLPHCWQTLYHLSHQGSSHKITQHSSNRDRTQSCLWQSQNPYSVHAVSYLLTLSAEVTAGEKIVGNIESEELCFAGNENPLDDFWVKE